MQHWQPLELDCVASMIQKIVWCLLTCWTMLFSQFQHVCQMEHWSGLSVSTSDPVLTSMIWLHYILTYIFQLRDQVMSMWSRFENLQLRYGGII